MGRFSTYYFKYSGNPDSCYGWEDRQKNLAALFEKDDSITFGEGIPTDQKKKDGIPYDKVFNHRVYHLRCNPSIIVMQIANSIDVPVENKFEHTVVKDEPSLFVIIDNREDVRTVAIQNRYKAFAATKTVARILASNIDNAIFKNHCYATEILPVFYPADLFKTWSALQQHAQSMKFSVSEEMTDDEIRRKLNEMKDKDYYEDSLITYLRRLSLDAIKANYKHTITVMPKDKKTALYVDKTTVYMKNLLTMASVTGEPVEIITKEGVVFKCFVEPEEENTDKVVQREMDVALLETLIKGEKEKGVKAETEDIAKAEEAVVEMLNGIKQPSKDIETTDIVA